jgi:(2R)-sulfolactate sulfo-lyase subunit alpha
MKAQFWIHATDDYVGVAVEDIPEGADAIGLYMDSGKTVRVQSKSNIPLGHKISLRDIKNGEKVLEYGEVIGATTKRVRAGDHVHTHNLKTLRW